MAHETLKEYIEKGYQLLKDHPEETLDFWNKGFSIIQDEILEPISFISLGQIYGYQMKVGQWLKDFSKAYKECHLDNDNIKYCQNVLKLFKDEKYMNDFYSSIGQSYFHLNQLDQAKQYFNDLLLNKPNELDIIFDYLTCLKQYDINYAKDVICRYVPLSLEFNTESEALFKLSKDILHLLHETDLERQYNKVKRIQDDFGKRKPTTKKVKIGRNDPCPCGSGKKYKQCCGKNK